MRRKRQIRRRIALIAVMLILCVLAGAYIVKRAGSMAKQVKETEEAEEIANAEAEAEAAAEEAAKEEALKESEHIYSYSGTSTDEAYTMAAYDSAANAGAGTIVLPFVVSQDGTLYVADDDYAQDMTGYGGYFSGMTDGQIDELNTRGGSKVLKLSDVFDKYGKSIRYVIELKYTGERNLTALKDIVNKYELSDVVSVSCQYFSGLRAMEAELPDVPKIFICSNEDEWGEALGLEHVDVIAVSKDMMSAERCKEAHDRNKFISVQTLSTGEDIKSALETGADSYFTDEAAKAVEVENAM